MGYNMFNGCLRYKKRVDKAYGLVSVCAGILLLSSMGSVSADELPSVSGVSVATSVSDSGVVNNVEVSDLGGSISSLDWGSSVVKFDTSGSYVGSSDSVASADSSVSVDSVTSADRVARADSVVSVDSSSVDSSSVDSVDSVDSVGSVRSLGENSLEGIGSSVVDSSGSVVGFSGSSELEATRRSIDEDTVLLNKVTSQISEFNRLDGELSKTLKELSLAKSLESSSLAKYNEDRSRLGSEVDSLRSSLESATSELNKAKSSGVVNFELVHDPVGEMDAHQDAILKSSSSGNVAILEKSDSKPADVYLPLTEEQYNSIQSGSGFMYTPNRENYIKHMLQNIKDVRSINGVDISLPPLADDAMDYAQRRAEELADLGKLDGHKAVRYSEETAKSRSGENIGMSSLLESKYLKYSKTSGLSDEELAYINFYSYMSEYNNVHKGNFGHAKNILTLGTSRGIGIGLSYRDTVDSDGFKRRDFYNTLDGYSADGFAGISVSDYREKFLPQVNKLGVVTLADGSLQYQFNGKPIKFIGRKIFHYTYNRGVDTAKVAELDSRVSDLTSRLGVASGRLSELERSYRGKDYGVSGIESRVNSLRSQLSSYRIGDLISQKGKLESSLSSSRSRLAKLESENNPKTGADLTRLVLKIVSNYPTSTSNSLARPVLYID